MHRKVCRTILIHTPLSLCNLPLYHCAPRSVSYGSIAYTIVTMYPTIVPLCTEKCIVRFYCIHHCHYVSHHCTTVHREVYRTVLLHTPLSLCSLPLYHCAPRSVSYGSIAYTIVTMYPTIVPLCTEKCIVRFYCIHHCHYVAYHCTTVHREVYRTVLLHTPL